MSKLGALREKAIAEQGAASPTVTLEEVPPLSPEAAPENVAFIATLMAGAGGENSVPDQPPQAFDEPQSTVADSPEAAAQPSRNDGTPAGQPDLLRALSGAIERLGPSRSQAEVLASPDAQSAWAEVRGLAAAALALGMSAPVEQVFRRYGAPGEGLFQAAQLKAPFSMALAAFKTAAGPVQATLNKGPGEGEPRPAAGVGQGNGGGGGGGGGVAAALAKLVAAPVTIPMAAGSRVWQLVQSRFGPRPKTEPGLDGYSVMRQQFDEAANRAIDQIAHLRSGPMKSFLTEMSQDPLRPSEQLRRMQGDKKGTYCERAKQLREISAEPEVQAQYKQLQDAMEHLQYRSRRLAEYGHEAGLDVEDIIGDKLESVAKAGEGIPMSDVKGKLADLRESIDALIERIREFLKSLFARPGASA
ncbi:hypothetical protein QE400_000017 [Xanthomonas sacchari]|uniref:hypothetical protein n=1 Tax=Xanthomonas sacchari TaxID=56458 RepID=UPI002784B886|nr:hypothetical protein [Xanthomonas sacchari]MDQ1090604.1 hypothetical protein [Xanthomonas sacchari]